MSPIVSHVSHYLSLRVSFLSLILSLLHLQSSLPHSYSPSLHLPLSVSLGVLWWPSCGGDWHGEVTVVVVVWCSARSQGGKIGWIVVEVANRGGSGLWVVSWWWIGVVMTRFFVYGGSWVFVLMVVAMFFV